MQHLAKELEALRTLEFEAYQQGKIAPAGLWLDTSPNSKGTLYVSLRSKKAEFDGRKSMSLGRVGSETHRDWQGRIARRNLLLEIERRALMIQEWLQKPLHLPGIAKQENSKG